MKLLLCTACQDLFKLDYELRTCKCGVVKGKYNADGHTAVVNGQGYSLAIGNGSLFTAIAKGPQEDYNDILFWHREHSGLRNPRTTVDENL